jgi:hypothetical protein
MLIPVNIRQPTCSSVINSLAGQQKVRRPGFFQNFPASPDRLNAVCVKVLED